LSFYQLFDVLNGLREVLALRPGLNLQRLFHYGGSQGGHMALLGAIAAPRTFAAIYSSCGAAYLEPHFCVWAGREFLPHEESIRSPLQHAARITCPVFLDHGTEDKEVSVNHTRRMEARLREVGTPVEAVYYEGGGHQLEPVSDRISAFKAMAPRFLPTVLNPHTPEFVTGETVTLTCADRALVIDWSQPSESAELMRWV
jgi:dipeptidyl aminopeptidase/acylaminoacyl peptidase